MENTKIDLGQGFSVEIMVTLPDDKGNTYEGFLYLNDEHIPLPKTKRQ